MALLSRASCDIASKMVTGRSAKTLFMEVMEKSAGGFGRQSGLLPAQDTPGEMLVVRKASGLRRLRGRYGAFAGAAGEHHFLALGIGNGLWIEGRKRDDYAAGICLDGDLVRLADIDQEIASLRHSFRYLLRHQILHLMIRHATILQRSRLRAAERHPISVAKLAPCAAKIKLHEGVKRPS